MSLTASLDLGDGALTSEAADRFAALKTTAPENIDASFTALIVPEPDGYPDRKVSFTVDGDTFIWTIPSGETFDAGEHYLYPVTINLTDDTGVSVTVGTASITPWTTKNRSAVTPEIVATEGTAGDLTWILTGDGTLTISGEGAMPDYEMITSPAPWIGHGAFIEKIVIESGVESIGDLAFRDCTNLKSIIIPEGVTIIGNGTFGYCSNLESVIIPEGVTIIGVTAFLLCESLEEITIPSSVTSVEDGAFDNCHNLTSVTVLATEPPAMGDYNFAVDDDTLYVPVGSVETYRNDSVWSAEFDSIEPIPAP